jgi:hypothetical protein
MRPSMESIPPWPVLSQKEVPQKEVRLSRRPKLVGRVIGPGERFSGESSETLDRDLDASPVLGPSCEAKKSVCESADVFPPSWVGRMELQTRRKNLAVASHALPNCDFWEATRRTERYNLLINLARPERFELPTPRFVVT